MILLNRMKTMENMKVTVIIIIIGPLVTVTKDCYRENGRTIGDHLNYSIVEIGQNSEKTPGDLKSFAFTQLQ